MDASRSTLGNTHPDTLVSIGRMGSVLEAQGPLLFLISFSICCLL